MNIRARTPIPNCVARMHWAWFNFELSVPVGTLWPQLGRGPNPNPAPFPEALSGKIANRRTELGPDLLPSGSVARVGHQSWISTSRRRVQSGAQRGLERLHRPALLIGNAPDSEPDWIMMPDEVTAYSRGGGEAPQGSRGGDRANLHGLATPATPEGVGHRRQREEPSCDPGATIRDDRRCAGGRRTRHRIGRGAQSRADLRRPRLRRRFDRSADLVRRGIAPTRAPWR